MRALLLALLLVPFCVSGQHWFPDEAVWHHGYANPFGQLGYVRMEVAGDTVVSGQTCRKLERTRHSYDFIAEQYGSQPLSPIMAYEAGGMVWVYVPSTAEFDTLYHFNAVPGDQWQLPATPTPVFATGGHMAVTGTGTMTLGATTLRWMAVNVHFMTTDGDMLVQDTIIERVGSSIYFLPHDHANSELDANEAGVLRCYQDAGVSYTVTGQPCDIILGIADATGTDLVLAYPNPNAGVFTLSLPRGTQAREVTVFDATGRLVLVRSVPNATGTLIMDISRHENGMYLVQVLFMDGARALASVAKE